MSATIAPMAGALDRPGDSMAAQSTKPGAISPMKKSVPRLVGAQAGKAGDGLAQRQIPDRQPGLVAHLIQACRRGGGGLLVLDINGGRADEQVAVHRGGDQHALAVLARQLEHGMPHMLPGRVVKQEVIAAPRRDLHGVGGVRHIVQRVGVYARRIDDAARLQRAVVGFDGPAASVRKGVQPVTAVSN